MKVVNQPVMKKDAMALVENLYLQMIRHQKTA